MTMNHAQPCASRDDLAINFAGALGDQRIRIAHQRQQLVTGQFGAAPNDDVDAGIDAGSSSQPPFTMLTSEWTKEKNVKHSSCAVHLRRNYGAPQRVKRLQCSQIALIKTIDEFVRREVGAATIRREVVMKAILDKATRRQRIEHLR